MTRAAVAAVTLVVTACSFTVRGPPADYRPGDDSASMRGARAMARATGRTVEDGPRCTREADGRLALDAAGGVLWAAVGVGALAWAADSGGSDEQGSAVGGAVSGFALSTVQWVALFVGRGRARDCRAAVRRYDAWRSTQSPAP